MFRFIFSLILSENMTIVSHFREANIQSFPGEHGPVPPSVLYRDI